MKKDGFNPRMNSESTKSLFKMNVEDIDQQNKLLESKLKKKKTKLQLIETTPIKRINLSKNSSGEKNKKAFNVSSQIDNSFVSNKWSVSPRESNISKTRSPNKGMSSFKNKLDSSVINSSNLEVRSGKTTKNLIPIPSHLEGENKMKEFVSKMKICQKHNLPNEKNYFVTEKNLKLIEEALVEKDADINNLKSLLFFAKNDFDKFKINYSDLNKTIEQQDNEKSELIKAFDSLAKFNKQLQENYDDYSFQYNKMLIFFKKIESLIHLVIKLKQSYEDLQIKSENFELGKKTKLIEIINSIISKLKEDEIKAYLSLFVYNSESSHDNKNFLKASVPNNITRLEKQHKLSKDKLYDYETFVKKLSFLYESKKFDLTDIARDMIETKKRISELDDLNESLERENEYLRISYHNLYVNLFNIE